MPGGLLHFRTEVKICPYNESLERKYVIFSLLILIHVLGIAAKKKPQRDSTTVEIRLDNISGAYFPVDSIYLVFDKYDRSGAGIVKQICYPVHNVVKITVPKGKYFINIICLGDNNHEYFDRIINAKANKDTRISIKLHQSDRFMPGLVQIPEEPVDLTNLSVTRYASNKSLSR